MLVIAVAVVVAVASYEADRPVALVATAVGLLTGAVLAVLARPGRPARVDGLAMAVAVYRRGGVPVRDEGPVVDTSHEVGAERIEGVDAAADTAWRQRLQEEAEATPRSGIDPLLPGRAHPPELATGPYPDRVLLYRQRDWQHSEGVEVRVAPEALDVVAVDEQGRPDEDLPGRRRRVQHPAVHLLGLRRSRQRLSLHELPREPGGIVAGPALHTVSTEPEPPVATTWLLCGLAALLAPWFAMEVYAQRVPNAVLTGAALAGVLGGLWHVRREPPRLEVPTSSVPELVGVLWEAGVIVDDSRVSTQPPALLTRAELLQRQLGAAFTALVLALMATCVIGTGLEGVGRRLLDLDDDVLDALWFGTILVATPFATEIGYRVTMRSAANEILPPLGPRMHYRYARPHRFAWVGMLLVMLVVIGIFAGLGLLPLVQ